MRQVLIVAYYFPPLGGIGSVRVCSFATHLPEYGWEPTVLAPSNGAYYRDATLTFPEERVVRSRSLEISRTTKRILRAGGDDVTPASPGVVRGYLQSAARQFLYYPDAQVGWYPAALRTGLRMMRERSFDAIFSSAYPPTAHLIAKRLHSVTGVPWVAEFRDPWTDLISDNGPMFHRAVRHERAVARQSSGLVMTSPTWARTHAVKWGRPVTVITNGCDGPVESRPDPGRFVVTHLGTMFPERQDLSKAWDAIRDLPSASSVDRLRFIGDLQPEVRAELDARGLTSRVEETGFLPREEATERLASSSALLLAGPRDGRMVLRGWIPAKLFEYLATDLPIIYVGHPQSDAAGLLRRHPGCHILDTANVDGIADALRACRGRRHKRDIAELTRRTLTGRLAELLDESCSGLSEVRREGASSA